MASISATQFADKDQSLVFVLYDDDTHEILPVSQMTEEEESIGSFIPLIEGGVIPLASIMWFCNQRVPPGYLLCDGSEVSRSRYQQLFRAIGTIYGSGDGQTTFNLPNLVGRFCRGWGPESPLDPGRLFGTYQVSTVKPHAHDYPRIEHTHVITDPKHTHEVVDPGHTHATVDPGHLHPVTDIGHYHSTTPIGHGGSSFTSVTFNNGAIELINGSSFYGYYDYTLFNASANMVVATGLTNIEVGLKRVDEVDLPEVTGVSIDEAFTNLVKTELAGSSETRPKNIALLPVIRY
jgi:microcystin-dependent protein